MSIENTEAKRFYFYMNAEQHMRLKIRLDHHKMGVSEFVRAYSEGLIEQDSLIEDFMEEYKERTPKYSKRNNKKEKSDRIKAKKLNKDLNLDMDEINDIFDIIEDSGPKI
jgi:cobyric acid synthase|tara:strand:+ start:335 stop:664 length:330 start_codon:yes stop_codon:yes gene_type:complete